MRTREPSCVTNKARCAMTALLAVVRCDCGGELRHGSEQTPRGLRWTFTCTRCGCRWGHRDGVFGPLDRAPIAGQLTPLEAELLALLRRLPQAVQQEIVADARARL